MPNKYSHNLSLSNVLSRSAAYLFLMILPVFLWLQSVAHLVRGHIKLIVDAQVCYRYTEYFFHHISRWVYPLWDPYHAWGRPDDFGVRMIGECNPLSYTIPLLQGLGATFSTAYACFYLSYFILGALGFFCLVKCLYRKFWLAYCAYCLVLLSNLGSNIFNDCLLVLIIVPAIWFYYFFVSFFKDYRVVDWLGLALTVMLINVTYMPFHFLVSLGAVLGCLIIFDPRQVRLGLQGLWAFSIKHPLIFVLALFSVALSLVPGTQWLLASRTGEYVVGWRSAGQDPLEMTMTTISLSSLVGPNSLRGLWADLDGMDLGLFYVPVFFWLILACGALVPVRRRGLIFISVAFLILLISLADFAPVFPFLFKFIFFFRYFRNLHYLVWFAWLAALLLFVDIFDWWTAEFSRQASKKMTALLLVLVHAVLAAWFFHIRNVDVMSYVSLGLNGVLLLLWGFCPPKPVIRYGLMAGFLLVILMPPVRVFQSFRQNTAHYTFTDSRQDNWTTGEAPVFLFARPEHQQERLKPYEAFGARQDTSGFFQENYYGLNGPHFLHEHLPRDIVQAYVKHKFILYDDFQCVAEDFDNKAVIAEVLSLKSKQALVVCQNSREKFAPASPPAPLRRPQVITADGERLRVRRFDLNEVDVQVELPRAQLLVYNDSYHRKWQVTVDGQAGNIFRTNVAFKGVWVPAGKHRLRFRYSRSRLEMFYKLLMIYFLAFFFLLLGYYVRELKYWITRGTNLKNGKCCPQ